MSFGKIAGVIGGAVGKVVSDAVKNKRPSNSSSGSSRPSSGGSSSGSSKPVNTNTSYNGNYLSVDLNQDYAKLQQDAAAKGDYTSAAKYEAMRNAKINYLNSIGGNSNKYSTSNNYVKDYGYTNNKGGQIFTGAYNDTLSFPKNWTDVTMNGVRYTRDNDGNIYQVDTANGNNYGMVANGINADTGEFTFNNTADARKVAYDRYLGTVGLGDVGENAYDYIENKGLVDDRYVSAIQNGTSSQYTQEMMDSVKSEKERQRQMSANDDYGDYYKKTPVDQNTQAVLDENSFETDGIGLNNDDYLQNLLNSMNQNNVRIY